MWASKIDRVSGFADVQCVISSLWHLLSPIRRDQAYTALDNFKGWELINAKRG